jgi:Clp protease
LCIDRLQPDGATFFYSQVVPCLALFDTMKYIGSDVNTVGFGACMGMSGFLLAVGKKVSVDPTVALSPPPPPAPGPPPVDPLDEEHY